MTVTGCINFRHCQYAKLLDQTDRRTVCTAPSNQRCTLSLGAITREVDGIRYPLVDSVISCVGYAYDEVP